MNNLRDQIEQAASLWEIQIRNSAHVKLKKQLTPKQFADQILALFEQCETKIGTVYYKLVPNPPKEGD